MPAALAVALTLVAGFYFLHKAESRAPDIAADRRRRVHGIAAPRPHMAVLRI